MYFSFIKLSLQYGWLYLRILKVNHPHSLSFFSQEQTTKPANGAPATSEANGKVSAPDSSPNAAISRQNKVNTETKSSSPVEQAATSKIDKDVSAPKEGPGTASSSPGPVKRKATNLTPKNKRLRMENEESMELKITWEEAQELLRPPPKAPSIVIVDGHEFEEYEVCHSFQHLSWKIAFSN